MDTKNAPSSKKSMPKKMIESPMKDQAKSGDPTSTKRK
jgi:hypothetical protein